MTLQNIQQMRELLYIVHLDIMQKLEEHLYGHNVRVEKTN